MRTRRSFGRSERIRRSCEFRNTRERGASYGDGVFRVTIASRASGRHRLGLTIGAAKVPQATRRNRLKRLIREVFRSHKHIMKGPPLDIIVAINRRPAFKADYAIVETRLLALLKKARAL